MATKIEDDPFAEDPFAEEKSSSEAESQPQEDVQEIDPQRLSIEEICPILQEKGSIHTTFYDYTILTSVEKVGHKWCYDSYVTHQQKKLDELIIPPEHGSSRAEEFEEVPPVPFVKRAVQKHLDQCRKVQELIEEEIQEKRARKSRKILTGVIVILLLALGAGGSYLFFTTRQAKVPDQGETPSVSPQLSLEYTTIRGKVETDQNGVPFIVLEKTDVVTVNVVDQATGKTVAQGIINIKLADSPQ